MSINCRMTRDAADARVSRAEMSEMDAHLNVCADCSRYYQELRSLTALLRSQPRVEAPADFEFRVRAGIARAKAAQSETSGFAAGIRRLQQSIFSGSFSGMQATAAAAAVAVIFTVTAYQFDRSDEVTPLRGSSSSLIVADRSGNGSTTPAASAVSSAPTKIAGAAVVGSEDTLRSASAYAGDGLAFHSGPGLRSGHRAPVAASPGVSMIEPSESEAAVSASASSMKVFNSEQGRMISASAQMTLIGAEVSSTQGQVVRSGGYVPSI